MLVKAATVLAMKREVTTREMELWVKHLGPTDINKISETKEALLRWFYEMQSTGLLPEDYTMKEIMNWIGLEFNKPAD